MRERIKIYTTISRISTSYEGKEKTPSNLLSAIISTFKIEVFTSASGRRKIIPAWKSEFKNLYVNIIRKRVLDDTVNVSRTNDKLKILLKKIKMKIETHY